MTQNSLEKFIESVKGHWESADSNLIAKCQSELDTLTRDPSMVSHLRELESILHQGHELYRDPEHGFVLMAYSEIKGLYRAPHDHGSGWVIYSVHSGEMEMGRYDLILNSPAEYQIGRRDVYRLKHGESHIYRPGDIHDTKCISDSVTMLRLTNCDLSLEKAEGRMHVYEKKTMQKNILTRETINGPLKQ